MRACSSSRASCYPLMVADPTLSAFFATILLPSSPHRKGTAQINLSDAVGTVFDTQQNHTAESLQVTRKRTYGAGATELRNGRKSWKTARSSLISWCRLLLSSKS